MVLFFSITGFLLSCRQFSLPSSHVCLDSESLINRGICESPGVKILYELHSHLLMGSLGSMLVGSSGLAILTVSITGITRWVGWKRPKQGFRIRKTLNSRMLLFDLHNALGAFSFLFLFFIGISGTLLSVSEIGQALDLGFPPAISAMTYPVMILIGHLHWASYQSEITLWIYRLFGLSISIVAATGMTMGLRNIYHKYKRVLL